MKTKETHCLNPNCKKELIHTEGRRPKKYCSPSCRNVHYKMIYQPKMKDVAGMIKLPDDFINVERVCVIKADGTIVELKTPDQLPNSILLAARAMKELKQDVNISSRTNSGLIVEFKAATEQSYDGKKLLGIKDEYPMTEDVKPENRATISRIMEIQKELKYPPKNPAIGLKNWIKVRENEIKELQKQLNPPI